MYDKTSPITSINEVREELFCKKNYSVERMSSTQDALLQHCKCSGVSNWNLDDQHRGAANASLLCGLFLDQNTKFLGTSLDHHPQSV